MSVGPLDLVVMRRLGAALRPIDARLLKPPVPGRMGSAWWQGDEPYLDVFLDKGEDGAPAWIQVTVRGRSVTWDGRGPSLRTGTTDERAIAESGYPASKELKHDDGVDCAFVALVVAMLEANGDPTLTAAASLLSDAGGRMTP